MKNKPIINNQKTITHSLAFMRDYWLFDNSLRRGLLAPASILFLGCDTKWISQEFWSFDIRTLVEQSVFVTLRFTWSRDFHKTE
jgi:hypothetical protein